MIWLRLSKLVGLRSKLVGLRSKLVALRSSWLGSWLNWSSYWWRRGGRGRLRLRLRECNLVRILRGSMEGDGPGSQAAN